MIKVLFWNIENAYNKGRLEFLNESTNLFDIIILAEAPSVYINGRIKGYSLTNGINLGANYIKVFKRDSVSDFKLKHKTTLFRNRVTVMELLIDHKNPILLFCVHLKSKVNNDNKTQLLTNILGSSEIHKLHEANNKSSIIIGDFNHNPFETIMMSVDGFNSIPNKTLIEHLQHRSLYYKPKDLFFNPMWRFLGQEKCNGTFFYKEKFHKNSDDLHWNVLDQVIISKDIMDSMDSNQVNIITEYKNSSTQKVVYFANEIFYPVHKTYINPETSDHLPISFTIEKQKLN